MTRILVFFAALCAVTPALAHMDMSFPTARYPIVAGDENKACPCGVGGTNRTCNIPIAQQVDPNRNPARVTTFQAGETITLVIDEYIGHGGRWRVAFDPDGAETADFNANILLDVMDPNGNNGNAGGSMWNLDVTLPNTPCDNCTLQLVQMMDGNMTDPVPDPTGRSSYYQCADIVLTGPEDAGAPPVDAGTQNDPPDAGGMDMGGCSHSGERGMTSSEGAPVGALLGGALLGGAFLFGVTHRRRRQPRVRV